MAQNVLESSSFQNYNSSQPKLDLPVIGISRDGVINHEMGIVRSRTDFLPIPGSLEAITQMREKGFGIAVITNQPGILEGKISQHDVDDVHQYLLELLGNAGCKSIDAIYYSTSKNKKDYYAKPNIGMFRRCEKEFPHIDFSKGYFVGNTISDLKAADRVGAKPILVRTGYGEDTEAELDKFTYKKLRSKTTVFNSLSDVAEYLT